MFDVVMSLYNKATFVEATIRAVIAQSFADWRLFVVDDGSTDGGAEIVSQFDDPRITLIHTHVMPDSQRDAVMRLERFLLIPNDPKLLSEAAGVEEK